MRQRKENALKYPEARGGFVMFHPPPIKNSAIYWTKVYIKSLVISIPPPLTMTEGFFPE